METGHPNQLIDKGNFVADKDEICRSKDRVAQKSNAFCFQIVSKVVGKGRERTVTEIYKPLFSRCFILSDYLSLCPGVNFEPEGRGFKSLRARQIPTSYNF